jgi:endonuclease IV
VSSSAKSKACFLDEMKRCELLGIKMLNIHPGSTKGKISIEDSCKGPLLSLLSSLSCLDALILFLNL